MKKSVLLLVVLFLLVGIWCEKVMVEASGGEVEICEETFPDQNFRAYIMKSFDINQDGILSIEEIEKVKSINISQSMIEDLKGIEHFSELTRLVCYDTNLTELDLSGNPKLMYLYADLSVISKCDMEDIRDVRGYLKVLKIINEKNCILDLSGTVDFIDRIDGGVIYYYWSDNTSAIPSPIVDYMVTIDFTSSFYEDLSEDYYCEFWISDEKCIEVDIDVTSETEPLRLVYGTYGRDSEWDFVEANGEVSGNGGVEQFCASINGNVNLGIEYSIYNSKHGWQDWVSDGEVVGIEEENIGAFRVQLTGYDKKYYDIYYRCKVQGFGWLAWANNSMVSGILGKDAYIEAIQVLLVEKGEKAPEQVDGVVSEWERAYYSSDEFAEEDNVPIDAEHFPNQWFRNNYVKKYDLNKDGSLSENEIRNIVKLNIQSDDVVRISNIEGIQYFTNLKILWIKYCEIESIDISKNLELEELNCEGNKLSSLNVSRNIKLKTLDCSDNLLSELDAKGNICLKYLDCSDNRLEKLEVDSNVEELLYRNNPRLAIDLSTYPRLKKIDCSKNEIESLDITGNLELVDLICSDNSLIYLDVSRCIGLKELDCSNNRLSELNLSKNANLINLKCGGNELQKLNVDNCKDLESVDCSDNQLNFLNLQMLLKLTKISCYDNRINKLELNTNVVYRDLNIDWSNLSDIQWNSYLTIRAHFDVPIKRENDLLIMDIEDLPDWDSNIKDEIYYRWLNESEYYEIGKKRLDSSLIALPISVDRKYVRCMYQCEKDRYIYVYFDLEGLDADVNVLYRTHVQTYGWQAFSTDGSVSGTSGQSKRLEAIEIKLDTSKKLGVQYTTHCQNYGWLPWSANGELNGTEGESKRLEAIKIRLMGEDADQYDIYYRVHAQTYGWLGWAKNGEMAGTAGYSYRLEAIQMVLVPKGQNAPLNVYQGITGNGIPDAYKQK